MNDDNSTLVVYNKTRAPKWSNNLLLLTASLFYVKYA